VRRRNPSGYPESQGAFTERMRREVENRLGQPCALELGVQTEFPKPPVRINNDLVDTMELGWSESKAWDELVRYYAGPRGATGGCRNLTLETASIKAAFPNWM
jgi:UDP-glucose 4-epimerase